MAYKVVVIIAVINIVNAGFIPRDHFKYTPSTASYSNPRAYSAPASHTAHQHDENYDPHPQYSFSYGVHDVHTGDIKSHEESRYGDVVKGSYSLVEPDGSRRTVRYSADSLHGFNAIVEKQPSAINVKTSPPVATQLPKTFVPNYATPKYNTPAYREAAPIYEQSYDDSSFYN